MPIGFTVEVSEKVWLIFDNSCAFVGVTIKARQGFYNIHDINNDLIGFFLNARDRVWLQFDTGNAWTGSTA